MARAVVYEPPDVQAHYAELVEAAEGEPSISERGDLLKEAEKKADDPAAPTPTEPAGKGEVTGNDGYLSKIAKYVPAETITLAALIFAAFEPTGGSVWIVVAIGAAANIIYLFSTALADKKTPLPRFYFYVLSVLAFVAWAVAVIAVVGAEVGIEGDNLEAKQSVVLAFAAFVIPALDSILSNPRLRGKG